MSRQALDAASEESLVEHIKAGDPEAFEWIVNHWSGSMLSVARSIVGTDLASDVVQDTWLSVIRSVRRFEGRASLRTWTFRILVNACHKRAKTQRAEFPAAFGDGAAADSADGTGGPSVDPGRFLSSGQWAGHWAVFPEPWPNPVDGALAVELREQLAAALATLPSRQRAVVVLRDVNGLTSEEVCAILEITAENQRVLLHRGRATLRARLEEYLDRRPVAVAHGGSAEEASGERIGPEGAGGGVDDGAS